MLATFSGKSADVYYIPEYGSIYDELENGICENFEYKDENGCIQNVFIKRKVPYLINGEQFFDAITPYGYGGPHITELNGDKEALLSAYWQAYNDYCKEQKIVCEFVRFHPLCDNALLWQGKYDVVYNRNTIAINTADADFFANQLTPECRNMTRKSYKKGVVIKRDYTLDNLDKFCEIYYATMRKDNASRYYFFERKYFEDLKQALGDNIFFLHAYLEDEIISSAMFMTSEKFMHYHLSATNPEFYSFAANNAILVEAAKIANDMGIEWFHLGGGLSGDADDRLFKFKRSFGRKEENLKDFYIGKCIFNEEVYTLLCEEARKNGVLNDGFFPEYR